MLGNPRLIPRYNWDYGLKELATAFGSILDIGTRDEGVWEKVFGCRPILTTSGRASLYTILKALELPKGAGVGVPLFCCHVVFDAVRQAGLVPVFLEINAEDYNVSVEDVSKKRGRMSAVVAVHMFGQSADMDSLLETCGEIPVIEDCAQALFSEYKGSLAGSRSLVSFFSFRSGKYISAGEGSAIFCQGKALRDKILGLVDQYEDWRWYQQMAHAVSTYIMSQFYRRPLYGLIGYRIGRALQKKLDLSRKSAFKLRKIAPVDKIVVQKRLEHFPMNVEQQRDNARYLMDRLDRKRSVAPIDIEGRSSNCYQFPLRFIDERRRDFVADYLFGKGIDCAKYLHDIIPAARELYGYAGDCPVAEHCSKTVLSIPVHYTMTRRDLDRVAEALNEADAMT
jgi:dTDP-4-amino-4,6-dideoxygalactose transaminase